MSKNNNSRSGSGKHQQHQQQQQQQQQSPANSRPNSRQQQQQQPLFKQQVANSQPVPVAIAIGAPLPYPQQQQQHYHQSRRHHTVSSKHNLPLLSSPRSERIGRKMYNGGSEAAGNSTRANQWLDLPGGDTMTRFHPHAINGGGGADSQASSSPPHRSQSFRHRSRPDLLLVGGGGGRQKNAIANGGTQQQQQNELADSTPERRRSTPTIHRRASMGRSGRAAMMMEQRIDVWPERKPMSEAEERFLQLPDQADYTRVRQFNIDAKGAVISRGDSFRRKRPPPSAAAPSKIIAGLQQQQPLPNGAAGTPIDQLEEQQQQLEEDIQPLERSSTGSSMKSSISIALTASGHTPPTTTNIILATNEDNAAKSPKPPAASPTMLMPLANVAASDVEAASCSYKICVLGQSGAGKSSLIRQFMSSSTAFSDADDLLAEQHQQQQQQQQAPTIGCCCVSVNIGGHECDLQFAELDLPLPPDQDDQLAQQMCNYHAFLLVYSIDRKHSFRLALRTLEYFRAHNCPAPVILVGNKADLERRRTVMEPEVRSAMQTFDVPHFEVSVALDHDVDDLLVGIVAQVKEAFRMCMVSPTGTDTTNAKHLLNNNSMRSASRASTSNSEDFHAAIRRFSQRKKRQMGVVEMGLETTKCMNLFEKLRKWRKGTSNC